MSPPVPPGRGVGLGKLPGGLDVVAVIILTVESQLAGTWPTVAANLTLGVILLALNLSVPRPRLFVISIVLTVLPIAASNLVVPGNTHLGLSQRAEIAAILSLRRVTTLLFGFAWIFSTNATRAAAIIYRLASLAGSTPAVFAVLSIALFPRIKRILNQTRTSVGLRVSRRFSSLGPVGRVLARASTTFRYVLTGATIRLGPAITDLATSVHSYGARSAERSALPQLEELAINIVALGSSYAAGLRENVEIIAQPGAVWMVSGEDSSLVSTVLRFSARINPLLTGDARGRLLWNGIELTADRFPLSTTKGHFIYVGARASAGQVGVDVAQHFAVAGISRETITSVASDWGLTPLLHREIDSLSGGQRARVQLAAAFASPAEILVLDEPFSELDDEGRRILVEALRKRAREGDTIILLADGTNSLAGTDMRTERLFVEADQSAILRPVTPEDHPSQMHELGAAFTFSRLTIPERHLDLVITPPLCPRAGAVVAIRGPNGSGKSSLFDALSGALRSDVDPCFLRLSLGYVMQEADANFATLTVAEELSVGPALLEAEILPQLGTLLKPLRTRGDVLIEKMSLFELRVLSLICQANRATVILFDEPEIHLSFRERADIAGILRRLADEGLAVVIATHSPEMLRFCDDVVTLSRGNENA